MLFVSTVQIHSIEQIWLLFVMQIVYVVTHLIFFFNTELHIENPKDVDLQIIAEQCRKIAVSLCKNTSRRTKEEQILSFPMLSNSLKQLHQTYDKELLTKLAEMFCTITIIGVFCFLLIHMSNNTYMKNL